MCYRARKEVDYAHSDKDFEDDDGEWLKTKPFLINVDTSCKQNSIEHS